ncbi:dihydropteroate synthase, partial [Candidatus Bipolaricaulota bacterium]|nr:dihydropteroate synthase [Candidatus Bipolaricaulota bacterium]
MKNQADRVLVMGILNVTPDSFYAGARIADSDAAIKAGLLMLENGADMLDIGGESSRPGADPVSADRELDRVLPVMQGLRSKTTLPLSIDTTKASVAKAALQAGADVINDISAMRADPDMAGIIAEYGAKVILMHMQGVPQTMQKEPQYVDVVKEVCNFLKQRAE